MKDTTAPDPGQVRLSGRLICANAQEAAIVQAFLPDHIRLTLAEPGCLTFDIRPTDDPLVWSIEESFRDKAAFDQHQTRTRASVWWSKSAHIARDYTLSGLD